MIVAFGYGAACERFMKLPHTSKRCHIYQLCHILKGLSGAKLQLISEPPTPMNFKHALAKQMFVHQFSEASFGARRGIRTLACRFCRPIRSPLRHPSITAGEERLELSFAVLETAVLPLHHSPIGGNRRARTYDPMVNSHPLYR